jgi:hypothetical protein
MTINGRRAEGSHGSRWLLESADELSSMGPIYPSAPLLTGCSRFFKECAMTVVPVIRNKTNCLGVRCDALSVESVQQMFPQAVKKFRQMIDAPYNRTRKVVTTMKAMVLKGGKN